MCVYIHGHVMAPVALLFHSTHSSFRKECEALGGKVDDRNRGFWCYKDGVYISTKQSGTRIRVSPLFPALMGGF